jgi:hypothetical protein
LSEGEGEGEDEALKLQCRHSHPREKTSASNRPASNCPKPTDLQIVVTSC